MCACREHRSTSKTTITGMAGRKNSISHRGEKNTRTAEARDLAVRRIFSRCSLLFLNYSIIPWTQTWSLYPNRRWFPWRYPPRWCTPAFPWHPPGAPPSKTQPVNKTKNSNFKRAFYWDGSRVSWRVSLCPRALSFFPWKSVGLLGHFRHIATTIRPMPRPIVDKPASIEQQSKRKNR